MVEQVAARKAHQEHQRALLELETGNVSVCGDTHQVGSVVPGEANARDR